MHIRCARGDCLCAKRKLCKLALEPGSVLTMAALLIVSHWFAPIVAGANSLNPYYFLSWGAPALFHEDVDSAGALIKLEPWRLLGLQPPVFAAIKPGEWEEPVVVQPPGDGDEKTRPTGDAVEFTTPMPARRLCPQAASPGPRILARRWSRWAESLKKDWRAGG